MKYLIFDGVLWNTIPHEIMYVLVRKNASRKCIVDGNGISEKKYRKRG